MNLHLRMAAITATAMALTATGLGSQPKSQPETKHIEIVASRFECKVMSEIKICKNRLLGGG